MTRKDYILIASVIKSHLNSSYTHINKTTAETEAYAVKSLAATMADELAKDNAMFDKDKFLKACGIE